MESPTGMTPTAQPLISSAVQSNSRSRHLRLLGTLSGFTAGAWLGAAEAPTKLVSIGISPVAISLIMVIGVFLARWSLPALILGTSSVRADVRRAPHLVIWALLAGCLWAVANTLTIFAIRDIGLSIAFPLWNSNNLLGILWDFLFVRRVGHDDGPFREFSWSGSVVAAIAQRAQRCFLADARRLRLGNRRHLPAIRCKVCGYQPRHPAFQFESALGFVVGHSCFRRIARPQFFHLSRSHRRLSPHDAWGRRH